MPISHIIYPSRFGGGYSPNGVVFDGTNDYVSRSATIPALTGAVDGTQLSIAVAFILTGTASDQHIISGNIGTTSNVGFVIGRTASDQVYLFAKTSAGTTILDINSSAVSTGSWHTLLASVDLTSASLRHLYIDDASDLATVTTYTNANIDFTGNKVAVGTYAGILGNNKFNGEMADLWFDPSYIDFSVEANRRKFFSAAGCLVDKGSDGTTPGFGTPIVYLGDNNDETDWENNNGDGGIFTQTGALTGSASDPCGV